MRTETSEALERLVSIFVAAIEGTGEAIPNSAIEQLATDPLGTCEKLNELALSCGALDETTDAALAAIYESMDAADARGAVDEECVARIVSAWTSTHVERPAEEPEPEPEPKQTAESGSETPAEEQPAEKPKRRRNRKAKEVREEDAKASEEPEKQGDASAEHVDVKPGRRSRAKAKAAKQTDAPAEAKPAKEPAEKPEEQEGAADKQDARDEPADAKPAGPEEETLGVEQAVAILGVSRPTIYKLIESGELPAHKKGRSWRISAAAVADRAAAK